MAARPRRHRPRAALWSLIALAVSAAAGRPAALVLIRTYQRVASPYLEAAGIRCRFDPTCSRYGLAVIERDGLIVGGWKTLSRVARCGPWTAAGTPDLP